jgi:hypothetical protein
LHAVLIAYDIEPGLVAQHVAAEPTYGIPLARRADGFVAGYWMEPQPSGNSMRGVVFLLFETEAAAATAAARARMHGSPGLSNLAASVFPISHRAEAGEPEG